MASSLKTQVVTNLYEFLSSVKPQKRYIEKLKSLFSKLWKLQLFGYKHYWIYIYIYFVFRLTKKCIQVC